MTSELSRPRGRLAVAVAPLLLVATLLLVAPLLLVATPALASDLRVANGWISMPILDEDPPVYFVIQNRGAETRTIVGASSAACERMSIRRAVVKDGQMASEGMDEMAVPAGGAVAFAPRGLFLRMSGVKKLSEGEAVSIELELADGEKVAFEAIVKDE